MATQRQVQFDMNFNVENLNTIGQLEDELSAINEQLKYVDVNSEAFVELSKQAQAADAKLRTINTNLEGVTSVEKAEGIRKIGDGLVGAFQVAAGASLIFSEKTNEQLQKIIAKVGGLYAAMDGIKKVTEAVSAENIKFVKSAIDGFKKSAIAAKLFGTTVRAALTATGIGALIVGIGLLIANWEKVIGVLDRNREKTKQLKDEYEDLNNELRITLDSNQFQLKLSEIYGKSRLEILQEELSGIQDELKLRKEILNNLYKQKRTDENRKQIDEEGLEIIRLGKEEVIKSAQIDAERLRLAEEKLRKDEEAKKKAEEQAKLDAEKLKAAQEKAKRDAENLQNLLLSNQELAKTLELEKEITKYIKDGGVVSQDIINNEERRNEIIQMALQGNEQLISLAEQAKKIKEDETLLDSEKEARLKNLVQAEFEYNQALLEKTKNLQTNLSIQTQEAILEQDLAQEQLKIQQEILAAKLEAAQAKTTTDDPAEIAAKENEIVKIKVEQQKVEQQIVQSQRTQNQLIAEGIVEAQGLADVRTTDLENLQNFLTTYNEEVNASLELMNATFDLFQNLAEQNFQADQERLLAEVESKKAALDKVTEYNLEKLDEIDERNQELADTEEELNELLRDAEGDRYNDILTQLQEVRTEQELNAAAEADLKKKEALAQYQYDLAVWNQQKAYAKGKDDQAKAEKTQAIINGIIQTTLAVIEALPSIPMSIIAGVLGGAAVAVIASQTIPKTPVPPKPAAPAFAEGGYTKSGGKYEPAGIVHAGEWVAPQTLVNDPVAGQMIATLEGMRRGYADGGMVEGLTTTSPNTPIETPEMIDYDRLAMAIAKQPIYASWTEGQAVGRKIEMTEDRSSI